MGRVHLKRKYAFKGKKNRKNNILIITIILIVIALYLVFSFISKKALPVLLNYAEAETTKFATAIINKAISESTSSLNIDDLFIITKDVTGEIKSMDFNPLSVNKLLVSITSKVQTNLRYVEKGKLDKINMGEDFFLSYNKNLLTEGVIFEIPFGIVFDNILLSNLGPKLPVRLNLVGDIVSNIKTNITNYGINNALIEISVDLEIKEQVLLPFTSRVTSIKTSIPLTIKLIEGTVPKYYSGGLNQNSPIFSLPIE